MNGISAEKIIELEPSFIKVPYEQLKKSFRHQYKYIEKEIQHVEEKIEVCLKSANKGELTAETATKAIDDLMKELEKFTQKIEKVKQEENIHAKRVKMRIENLREIEAVTSTKAPEYVNWSKTRLDRVIVDYLLREGMPNTATKVAKDSQIEDMVDIQLFAQAKKIQDALQRHSCKECLQWCSDNRSGLKKSKSTLEFNLRLQEHIELARAGRGMDAIKYAQKYLAPWKVSECKRIGQAMGLLIYKSDTECQPYKDLYDNRRWTELIEQFRRDNYQLCSLTSHPLLSITLQAGLSALKTPQCYQHENQNVNCPICDNETLGSLAEKLPLSHHVNSAIVCRINGKIMNEDNPPMLLPNGRVYSLNALQDLASKNDGKITCPRTGDVCRLEDLRKVFIS